jgi:uncharacterized repeat protein (TIGR02543 family)
VSGSITGFAANEPVELSDGRTLIVVNVEGIIGSYKDDLSTYGTAVLDFKMKPRDTIKTASLNQNDLVLFGNTDGVPNIGTSATGVVSDDALDFNQNGSTTDRLVKDGATASYTITSEPNFNIFAEVGLPNGPKFTYDDATADTQKQTSVAFTSVSEAEYVLNIANNMSVAAGEFESYVPVPKRGKNYGADFQSANFAWSMGLKGAPTGDVSGYTITYTTDDVSGGMYADAGYKTASLVGDWSEVTMVKIRRTTPIAPNTEDAIVFRYTIEETADYAALHSGESNIFHPYYRVVSASVTGWKSGKDVATLLAAGEVKGRVWVDTDGNGIRDGAEAYLANVPVRLRLPDSPNPGYDYTTSASGYATDSDADGNYVQTTTASDGSYEFPGVPAGIFQVQVLNPDTNLYVFTKMNEGADATVDSDVTEVGLTPPIDSTDISKSGFIFAGLKYKPYTVAYNPNLGTAITDSPQTVRYNQTNLLALITSPTRTGYNLTSWNVTDGGTGTGVTNASVLSSLLTPGSTALTLAAQWTAKSYTVAYDDGYTDTTLSTESGKNISYVDNVTPPSDPTRVGYTFGGWSKTKGGNAASTYRSAFALNPTAINDLFANDTTLSAKLYAVWTARTVDVTYNSNGGSTVTGPSGSYDGVLALAPLAPTKTGYVFGGWYYDSGLNNAFTHGAAGTGTTLTTANGVTDYSPASEAGDATLILYAKWTARTVDVNYASNGGDDVSSTTGTYNGVLTTAPAAPTKTGYVFGGWYYDSGLNNAFTYGAAGTGTTLTIGHGVTDFQTPAAQGNATLTLYAKWNARTVDVAYNSNGGNAVTGVTGTYDGVLDSAPTAPTKTGYVFAGWYYDSGLNNAFTHGAAGTGTTLTIGHGVTDFQTSAAQGNATLTLYAKWTAKDVTVTYYRNHDALDDTTVNAGYASAKYDAALGSFTAPTRDGYDFSGWWTARETGGIQYTLGENGLKLTAGNGVANADGEAPSLGLYARWTAFGDTPYTVEHYLVGADGVAIRQDADTEPKTGVTDTPATAAAKTYTGYTYAPGYVNDTEGHNDAEIADGNIAGDGSLVLKLYYTINRHDVSYGVTGSSPSGAPVAPPKATGVPYGANTTVAAGLVLAGYNFSNWTPTAESGITVGTDGVFSMPPDRDVAFTGYWTARTDTPYKVEHYLVNVNGVATRALTENRTGTTDTNVNAVLMNYVRTYVGYGHAASYGQSVLSGKIAGNGSLTLRLYYTLKGYTVNYDLNGGEGSFSPRSATWFDTGLLPARDPALANHTFTGWTANGNAVTNATAYSALAATDGVMSVTLRAEWTRNLRTVIYAAGGAGVRGLPASETVGAGNAYTIPTGAPTRAGYAFNGWSASTGNRFNPGASFTAPDYDITLTALWTANAPADNPTDNPTGNPTDDTAGNSTTPGGVSGPDSNTTVRSDGSGNTGTDPNASTDMNSTTAAGREIADPNVRAFADEGVPVIDVGPLQVPLYGKSGLLSYGLLNLVFLLIGLVLAVQGAFRFVTTKRRAARLTAEGYGGAYFGAARAKWFVPEALLAVIGLLMFFSTQSLGETMTFMDAWTPISAAVVAGIIITNHLAFREDTIQSGTAAH